jgi:hypothetical protein
MEAREVIARRSDLSTFLVHLTRSEGHETGAQRLEGILHHWQIAARSMFGAAKRRLEDNGDELDSQKCVCFTETPLEYLHLLLETIDNRQISLDPYGVALPKKVGRRRGVNPVWYVDITPGHDWLMPPINNLIDAALAGGGLTGTPIEKIAPFIEQMGTQRNAAGAIIYRKEFWWEREWRHVGAFDLPDRIIVVAPEDQFSHFSAMVPGGRNAVFVDPSWGLEQLIGRLSGYTPDETDIL